MAYAKRASKQKHGMTALPALGAVGVSLAIAGGASATAPTANGSSQDTVPRPVTTLADEEIADVSLATFYVFDKETASRVGEGQKLARRGCGGCRGCGGRGCRGCRSCAARACGGCSGCSGSYCYSQGGCANC
jgi:hypothetical protein